MANIAETKEYEVLALEMMPVHIHLFVSAPPFESPTDIVKVFRGARADSGGVSGAQRPPRSPGGR